MRQRDTINNLLRLAREIKRKALEELWLIPVRTLLSMSTKHASLRSASKRNVNVTCDPKMKGFYHRRQDRTGQEARRFNVVCSRHARFTCVSARGEEDMGSG